MSNVKNNLVKVDNTERRFGSATEYFILNAVVNGKRKFYMFTEKELYRAEKRAIANAEDLVQVKEDLVVKSSWLYKISSLFKW